MTELVGTGPFTFRESRTGEYVHMTRNEHYMLLNSQNQRTKNSENKSENNP